MSISFSQQALVASPGAQYSFSSLVSMTAGSLPEYLVVTGMDYDRYTVTSKGDLGTLSGNGNTLSFKALGLNYAFGVMFTHTDQGYYNSTYGSLSDLAFKTSTDNYRNEYLSLYGFGTAGKTDATLATQIGNDLASANFDGTVFMQTGVYHPGGTEYSASNYLGSLDVVTRTGHTDATPNLATPNEVVAVAKSFIGETWNDNGCWVLVSNIAAAAGATLPLTAARARPEETPPVANGQWFVAYNSVETPVEQQPNWTSLLRPGDMVIANNTCGGHIATVVEGFGAGARIIDNGGAGSANDGSANDILIGPAHRPNALTFPNDFGHVVIYRLDAPVIADVSPLAIAGNATAAIAPLISVSDPRGGGIVGYQIYDTNADAGCSFIVGGTSLTAHSPESAISVDAAGFADVRFAAGSAEGGDAIMVRAYNGRYWGDWQDIDVALGASLQPAVLSATASELKLHGGESVALTSLVSASSPDSTISYYNVVDPAFGGSVQLNGATSIASRASPDGGLSLDFLPEQFAKLRYQADTSVGGEMLTITAHNGSPLASVPLSISLATVAPSVHGIPHAVEPGEKLSFASLFSVTLADDKPIVSYTLSTSGIVVIDWGSYLTPSSGGSVLLNGATNLLPDSPGNWLVAAADLDKVQFQAAPDAGTQFLAVWANDGGSGVTGSVRLDTVATATLVTPLLASVHTGDLLPVTSLFTANSGTAPAYYRILDPVGGGSVQLDPAATNLLSKSDTTPGLFIVASADLGKVGYLGGSADGSEALLLSSSDDLIHWAAEKKLAVTTTGVSQGGQGDDRFIAESGNELLEGGSGFDVAVYAGKREDFTITRSVTNSYKVTDQAGDGGRDTLNNLERISFSDMTVNLTVQAKAAAASSTDVQRLAELYVAFFNRVPDADGLAYWIDRMSGGMTIDQIADSFYDAGIEHSTVTGYSANMSNQDFIDMVYKNALGRSSGADAEGREYWNGMLTGGQATHGSLVTDILDSAHTFKGSAAYGWVADLLDNKIAVSNKFAIELGLSYNSADDSISQCMSIAAAVTSTSTADAIALIGIPGAL
ncbi:MAG: DUF4214 domain-containing protein [Betaproteobacteria bacterium]|nr:DUF4214 domain-containing protein [Betaproteobacteria bacterium]